METTSEKFSLSIKGKARCKSENKQSSRIGDSNSTSFEKQDTGCIVVKITSELTQIGRNGCIIFDESELNSQRSREETFGAQNRNDDRTTDESSELDQGFVAKPKRRKRKEKLKSSQSEDLALVVHKNLQPAEPPKSLFELYDISNDVTIRVQKLRDNGRWDLFEETAVELSRKYTTFDAQIILLLERAIAACYSNRLDEAKKMIKSAIEMANESENADALIGRALYYLSAVYRRENKTGKAIDCVELAVQSFSNYGVVTDRCALTYEQASALMDFILQCPQPKPALLEKVLSNLKRSIDECLILLDEDKPNLYVKTHHYALIKIAMLLLDCRNTTGRQRSVKRENVEEAGRYLAILKDRYWHKTSRGEKIQYLFGQADLHFRRAQFPEAKDFAQEALKMAKSYGFNTEIRLAQERLHDITSSWDRHELVLMSRDRNNNQSVPSPGHVADRSASSDSDWLIQTPI